MSISGCLVGLIEGIAVPVRHRAVEPDLAILAEMQHVLAAANNSGLLARFMSPQAAAPM